MNGTDLLQNQSLRDQLDAAVAELSRAWAPVIDAYLWSPACQNREGHSASTDDYDIMVTLLHFRADFVFVAVATSGDEWINFKIDDESRRLKLVALSVGDPIRLLLNALVPLVLRFTPDDDVSVN